MGVIRLTGAVPRLEACWIQIILSLILEIQNNINTQKQKYLCKNHFFLKKKNHETNSKSIHYYQKNYNNSKIYAKLEIHEIQ